MREGGGIDRILAERYERDFERLSDEARSVTSAPNAGPPPKQDEAVNELVTREPLVPGVDLPRTPRAIQPHLDMNSEKANDIITGLAALVTILG